MHEALKHAVHLTPQPIAKTPKTAAQHLCCVLALGRFAEEYP